MYEARALVNLCKEIGDDVLVSLVAERLFTEVLPSLERHFMPEPSASVSAALLECFMVLEGILPALLPSSVVFHYCTQPTLPIQQLLITIPLPPPPSMVFTSPETGSLTPLRVNSPRHRLHIQICRLLASVCMYIGAENTKELILPAVNAFIGGFTDLYEELDDAEPTSTAFSLKKAAFHIVEDLWRQLDAMFSEADQQHHLPNAGKMVVPWFQSLKGQQQGQEGSSKDSDRGGAAGLGNGKASSKEKRPGMTERERLAELVIEKGLSGLSWIAFRSKRSFHRDRERDPRYDSWGSSGGGARAYDASGALASQRQQHLEHQTAEHDRDRTPPEVSI